MRQWRSARTPHYRLAACRKQARADLQRHPPPVRPVQAAQPHQSGARQHRRGLARGMPLLPEPPLVLGVAPRAKGRGRNPYYRTTPMESTPAWQSGATSRRRAETSTFPLASAGVIGKAESPFNSTAKILLAASISVAAQLHDSPSIRWQGASPGRGRGPARSSRRQLLRVDVGSTRAVLPRLPEYRSPQKPP